MSNNDLYKDNSSADKDWGSILAAMPMPGDKAIVKTPTAPEPSASTASIQTLAGKTVVFTGKMSRSRAQMESHANRNNVQVSDKVKWGVDFLVTGERVGKVKTDAANKANVTVITENEYWNYF